MDATDDADAMAVAATREVEWLYLGWQHAEGYAARCLEAKETERHRKSGGRAHVEPALAAHAAAVSRLRLARAVRRHGGRVRLGGYTLVATPAAEPLAVEVRANDALERRGVA